MLTSTHVSRFSPRVTKFLGFEGKRFTFFSLSYVGQFLSFSEGTFRIFDAFLWFIEGISNLNQIFRLIAISRISFVTRLTFNCSVRISFSDQTFKIAPRRLINHDWSFSEKQRIESANGSGT